MYKKDQVLSVLKKSGVLTLSDLYIKLNAITKEEKHLVQASLNYLKTCNKVKHVGYALWSI